MRSMVEGISAMLAGPIETVKRACRLRRAMSVPEVILWSRLRRRPAGFKFRRQHPAGQYVLDFFCSDASLAIEIDGISHDMGDRPAVDAARVRWLQTKNIVTLRLAARDVASDPDAAVETIVAACREGVNPLHHPADGPPPRSGEESE